MVFTAAASHRRSYDGDEVDAFLTEAEREFTRLQSENRELRAQARHCGPSVDDLMARLGRLTRELAGIDQHTRDLRTELAHAREARQGRTSPASGPGEFVALAQRFADSHVRNAEREADALLSTARATADKITSEAHLQASTIDSDARARHLDAIGRLAGDRDATLAEIERLNGVADALRDSLRERMMREVPRVLPLSDAPDEGPCPPASSTFRARSRFEPGAGTFGIAV
ncbi:hypothetical protein AB0G04_33340 [Actinoplanes sp. NPDC023801]|uniref:DivIVA domain-containing protein n=1 Tax=Actinoplanes sp. NPDC023801 TaxID=3154595 RepID=UPI0033F9DCA4